MIFVREWQRDDNFVSLRFPGMQYYRGMPIIQEDLIHFVRGFNLNEIWRWWPSPLLRDCNVHTGYQNLYIRQTKTLDKHNEMAHLQRHSIFYQ